MKIFQKIYYKLSQTKRIKQIWFLMLILSIGLIPLNLRVLKFPEWVIWIPGVLALVLSIFNCFLTIGKKARKAINLCMTIIVVLFTAFNTYCNPYWNSMLNRNYEYTRDFNEEISFSDAKEDLQYMMHYLKKCHPLFINGLSEEISNGYHSSLERLKNTDTITVTEVEREMQSILALIGDGHTTAFDNYISYCYLKDIAKRNYEGWRLTAINNITLEELFKENKYLYSYELENWGKAKFKSDITSLSGLSFLELNPNGIRYTWVNEEGEEEISTYEAKDYVIYSEYMEYNKQYFEEESNESNDFVSYKIYEDNSLAVLTLESCNYDEQYKSCLKKMFSEMKEKNIQNVAVDLRGNGGGNSKVATEFIKYLSIDEYNGGACKWRLGFLTIPFSYNSIKNKKYVDLVFDGNVYVLTNVDSFSSAMLFAQYIQDNDIGTVIGEIPGNTPNCFGEIATFELPNTRLYFQVSTKEFTRVDKKNKDNRIVPDIACDGDTALDKLLEITHQ